MSHWDMKDKVAIVTGGTSGIGRSAAIAMATAGQGWLRAADARKRGLRWLPRSRRQGVRPASYGPTWQTKRTLRCLSALRRQAMGGSISLSIMPGLS
jgi:NAD(P)-dependent dehydrogenase (short-subunit alcohol dehydrogenase family)